MANRFSDWYQRIQGLRATETVSDEWIDRIALNEVTDDGTRPGDELITSNSFGSDPISWTVPNYTPRSQLQFTQNYVNYFDIALPNPEIAEQLENARRQLEDAMRIRTDEMVREVLMHGSATVSMDIARDDSVSARAYVYSRAIHINRTNKQGIPMTRHLKFDQTIPLATIKRYCRASQHELIENIYNNDFEFYTERTVTKEDFLNSGQSIITFVYENPEGVLTSFDSRIEFVIQTQQELINGMEWSNIRTSYINFDRNHLLEQIRNRYAFFDRPISGLSNIIIDNYAPKLMYLTNFNQNELRGNINLPKTIYTISPWFAQYFGAQQVPTEQLCRIIGYDIKTLKNLITKVKRKNYTVTFVGYGGTVVNTIHWLTEIMKVTQSVNLFKQIEIFEPDTLEISNLLRFPKNPYIENTAAQVESASKLRLLSKDELALLSRNNPSIRTQRIDGNNLHRSTVGAYYNSAIRGYSPKDNHIFYGAPNIDTRASFEGIGHFISATHNGNDAHLWLNPTQDSDLQVESYGLIQLTPFFMNQLRLAIGFLETLALDDLDLKGPELLLLEYSFDGESKLSTNRTYNFQLGDHDGTVTTEEGAIIPW